jgi:hypothetical protein
MVKRIETARAWKAWSWPEENGRLGRCVSLQREYKDQVSVRLLTERDWRRVQAVIRAADLVRQARLGTTDMTVFEAVAALIQALDALDRSKPSSSGPRRGEEE